MCVGALQDYLKNTYSNPQENLNDCVVQKSKYLKHEASFVFFGCVSQHYLEDTLLPALEVTAIQAPRTISAL